MNMNQQTYNFSLLWFRSETLNDEMRRVILRELSTKNEKINANSTFGLVTIRIVLQLSELKSFSPKHRLTIKKLSIETLVSETKPIALERVDIQNQLKPLIIG